MSKYRRKKYSIHRLAALVLAGVLVAESVETGTLTAAAEEGTSSAELAGVSAGDMESGTFDGGDALLSACGYVAAPDEAPAPVSELNVSLDQARRLLENTDQASAKVMAADQSQSVPAAYPYGYEETAELGDYLTENLPAVRNQNPYGTCWAHATTGAVEMDMITRYGEPISIDYSELHLIYWSLHQGSNPVMGDTGDVVNASAYENYMRAGGNSTMTSQALLRRRGIAAEETLPYSAENTADADAGTFVADPADEFHDVAHLKNHYRISISGNADHVKEAIMEHGGVQVSYYDDEKYYSSQYNSFNHPSAASTNHAVMLVGWDDSFPKENFKSVPSGDGAWLVRNSWGYASSGIWSRQKYFWISYYDAGLLKCDTADVFEMIPADQGYDNQYFYDTQLCLNGYYSRSDMKAANIYTVGGKRASSAERELIGAVSIVLVSADAPYTVQVYTGLTDSTNPTSGTLAATMSGTAAFAGEYTIELPEPVMLNRGELFSVVVTGDTAQEYNYSSDSVVAVNEGESFVNWGYGWKDQAIYGHSGYGNFRIYALTTDAGRIKNLKADRDGSKALLSWDAVDDADTYEVYRGSTADALVKIGEITDGTASYIDTGLDAGQLYYYQVQANSGMYTSEICKLLRELAASDLTVTGTGAFVYDGTAKEFSVRYPDGIGSVKLIYYKVGTDSSGDSVLTALENDEKPMLPGSYQLGVELTGDGDVFAATKKTVTDSSWRIAILRAQLYKDDFVFQAGQVFYYDGEAHTVRPETSAGYNGTISYKYAPVNNGSAGEFTTVEPSGVGVWQVSVDGNTTDLYDAFTGITDSTWRFRILEFITVEKPSAQIVSGEGKDGAVADGARLMITVPTAGAVIYYTLDGSIPTAETGVKYTAGITLKKEMFDDIGELTVKAIAIKSSERGDVVSELMECTYRIEKADFGDILEEDKRAEWKSPEDVPSGIWIGGLLAEMPYTGKAVRFDNLRIYDHTTLLPKSDYRITYSPNVNAGIVTITVKGMGDYTGQIQDCFTITKADLGEMQDEGVLSVEELYLKATGKDLLKNIKPVVKWNGTTLKLNKDYKVIPQTEDGQIKDARVEWYTVRLDADAAQSRNFTGHIDIRVKVYEAETVDLKNAVVTKIPTQPFPRDLENGYTSIAELKDASGQPLAFIVKAGGKEVPSDVYSVRFENADRSGTATLVIEAVESSDALQYTGVKKVTFKIGSDPVKTAFDIDSIPDQTYTGNAIMPEITVKDKSGNSLVENESYTVKYSNNINAGTAKAVITGRTEEGYSGSVTVKFKINRYLLQCDSTDADDILYDHAPEYVKGQTNPAVTIRVPSSEGAGGYITLVQGKDYSVKYVNNKAVADSTQTAEKKCPAIIITGKGGYETKKGGIKLYYSILGKDIGSDTITASARDKVYKRTAGNYKSTPVFADANGKTLKAGTDYDKHIEYRYVNETTVEWKEKNGFVTGKRYPGDPVEANDIVPAGTMIKMVVRGQNNYDGCTEVTYRVVAYDLSKAKVTVKPQTYTGAPVYPDGTAESDLSVAAAGGNDTTQPDVIVTFGGRTLVYGTDYTIIEWSDNIRAGKNKATLTIVGCAGNPLYGGSKKVKFSITQKKF